MREIQTYRRVIWLFSPVKRASNGPGAVDFMAHRDSLKGALGRLDRTHDP
jgi:hypothetical protein